MRVKKELGRKLTLLFLFLFLAELLVIFVMKQAEERRIRELVFERKPRAVGEVSIGPVEPTTELVVYKVSDAHVEPSGVVLLQRYLEEKGIEANFLVVDLEKDAELARELKKGFEDMNMNLLVPLFGIRKDVLEKLPELQELREMCYEYKNYCIFPGFIVRGQPVKRYDPDLGQFEVKVNKKMTMFMVDLYGYFMLNIPNLNISFEEMEEGIATMSFDAYKFLPEVTLPRWLHISVKGQNVVFEINPEVKGEKVRLKLFLMSNCPFGNKAEEQVKRLISRFEGKLEVEPHYILSKGQSPACFSGFCSLHGAYEAEQDLRELCVYKLYGFESWLDFVTNMNDSIGGQGCEEFSCWPDVAQQLGLDVNRIQKCFDENIGLLEQEVAISEAFGVTGSPTYVVNDTYTRVGLIGRDEDFKNLICAFLEEKPSVCFEELTEQVGYGGAC